MFRARVRSTSTKNLGEKVARGARSGMEQAASKGFTVSQEEVPKDRGSLLQSGVPPTWTGDDLVWGYSAAYARFVEEGTAPHYPPIEPLKGWASRVLGDEQAAWAVQEKIGQKGTDPQPYAEPGFEAMVAELRARGLGPFIEEEL